MFFSASFTSSNCNIISSHQVEHEATCFFYCFLVPTCVVFKFNHKARNKFDVNCQLINATEEVVQGGEGIMLAYEGWVYYRDFQVSIALTAI